MTAPAGERVAVVDSGLDLRPDAERVVTRFFLPGDEGVGPGASRAGQVLDRLLALDEAEVVTTLAGVDERFGRRHRELRATFLRHASAVLPRIESGIDLSPARQLLLGALFTHEYAVEAAALCNPSAVLHPVQDGNGTRFVLSTRGVGEGHRSTIGFRTGRLDPTGAVTVDPPGPFPTTAPATAGIHHRAALRAAMLGTGADRDNTCYVLDPLPSSFTSAALEERLALLAASGATRRNTVTTIAELRALAASGYQVAFSEETELSERVLWPYAPAESNGMEDARFVRITDGSAGGGYYATYTAFDGRNATQHLLHTADFRTFAMSPVAGNAAVGKGLALFPRQVGGRFAALSRADRETNAIAFSDDLRWWNDAEVVQAPRRPWELLQLGNCGSPIETDHGWLVLTHGVGPMRTYVLGAILLDLAEPSRLIARSNEPLLVPGPRSRGGYVPNVVYSCGALAVGDTLVLPYGVGDQSIGVATLSIGALVGSMSPPGSVG